jgi:predicted nucleotidyltransferase
VARPGAKARLTSAGVEYKNVKLKIVDLMLKQDEREKAMRLSKEERNAICAVLRRADPNGKVILFGSRTDDARRGGDIDIYFETEKQLTLDDEIRLDIDIEDACDTKVYLLIKTPDRSDRPIFKIARKGIVL